MLIHEDFVRCPHCKNPFFKTKEVVILDKEHYNSNPPSFVEKRRKTIYSCESCGKVLDTKIEEY